MNKTLLFTILGFMFCAWTPYQQQYVEAKASSLDGESFGIIRLSRKDNRIKVKYFAAKDGLNGKSVYQRYQAWSTNKKVIAFSSGTYMDNCEISNSPVPIGLCIDQGNIVNNQLVTNKLDALAIVYATGGMVVSNLADGNLTIVDKSNNKKTLNVRDPYQKIEFMNWAEEMEATVFQTHLFVYQDKIKVASNSSSTQQERRFLAACKGADSQIYHYIINLPTASTLYNGVTKAYKILKQMEEVSEVVFMINLDTGCQNVLSVFRDNGTERSEALLRGNKPITSSVNLLAYYFE